MVSTALSSRSSSQWFDQVCLDWVGLADDVSEQKDLARAGGGVNSEDSFFLPLLNTTNQMNIVCRIIAALAVAIAISLPALAFSPSCPNNFASAATRSTSQLHAQTRSDFLSTASTAAIATAAISQPAYARGRATLEQTYERYTPRIIEGGKFYKGQLYPAIAKQDWKSIEAGTAEPPKKAKADRALPDGGVAKRAALAGGFSDARVLVRCLI